MKGNSRVLRISWNKENPEEVALAEKKFKERIRKGWIAFIITSENLKAQIFSFDPTLGEILLVPIAEGG